MHYPSAPVYDVNILSVAYKYWLSSSLDLSHSDCQYQACI